MPDPSAPPTPAATPRAYVLWFRGHSRTRGRGRPWEMVATAASEREAWSLATTPGRPSGDYCALPAGQEP